MRVRIRHGGRCHQLPVILPGALGAFCALAAAAAPAADLQFITPTQGRPVFVAPGTSFVAVADLAGATNGLRAELVARTNPPHYHPLIIAPPTTGNAGSTELQLSVPADVPEQTYDLKLTTARGPLVARHAVAVQRLTHRLRLVHLSNMNVGDVGAPHFDQRLVDEINLLAPTLIVATGDYLDVTHPNPPEGWQDLADFLARFDAPCVAACGDHDDLTLYTQYLAPSPIGTVGVGSCQVLLLYDVPGRPIYSDESQIHWVEQQLGQRGPRLRLVVSHDQRPNLLSYWQEQGMLQRMIKTGRLGLWLAGGHRDWDGVECRDLIAAAAPLLYARTHQSSTVTQDGAEGISHYRIIDLDRERAIVYGTELADDRHASLPVGRIELSYDGPNDGTRSRVAFNALSTHPFRLPNLQARLLLRRAGGARPWCRGARLVRLVDLGRYWECRVEFDLPDKGAVRVVAGTGTPPELPQLDVSFDMPARVTLVPRGAGDERYLSAADWVGIVHVHNRGSASADVSPLIRLDGQTVAYRVVNEPGPFATAYKLRLGPQQTLALQLDLSAGRFAPGRRELQVYLSGLPAQLPVCQPLELVPANAPGTAVPESQ